MTKTIWRPTTKKPQQLEGGDIQVLGTWQKGFEDQELENHDGDDHLQNVTKQGWMPTNLFTITYKTY
jgi:hypothetical protein